MAPGSSSLASLADFRLEPGPERIQRDNRITSVWVGARYEEGTIDDYLPRVTAVLESMDFPYGYSFTFRDFEERRKEKTEEFLVNLTLALLLIFAVMVGLFESVRQTLGLMVALPFAAAGAFWTLYFTGTDFDQPAAIGLLLLIGVVVNNGIVMIEHINMYRRRGMPRHEAMIRGGRERLRPILMTAITTLVGLVPTTFLTSVLLPTTASLAEDGFALVGRGIARTWRVVTFRGRKTREV